jgi:hypothetical protein
MWHIDTLLGKDREISNYTTAVPRQWLKVIMWSPQQTQMQQLHNRGMVFSMRSVSRCYKQGQLAVVVS